LKGFTWRPNPIPVEDAIAALKTAVESGATLWNGAEMYGPPEYNSMILLNKYFTKYPEDAAKVTLVIKGGVDVQTLAPQCSPEMIRKSADNILNQLGGKKKLDVFGINRRDRNVPLEVTLGVLQKEYVETGKIGGISLSECSADTVREASKYVKVAAVEVEVSMFTQDNLDNGVAQACAELNIPVTAYSPMGRGILTGSIKSTKDAEYLGFVGSFPRFQEEAMAHNLKLVDRVHEMAREKGCSSAQLALAWVRSISKRPGMPVIIPIPGATKPGRVQENSRPVELSDAELKRLDRILEGFSIAGTRYPQGIPIET